MKTNFFLGVIWGRGKPRDANEIFEHFVAEMLPLKKNGFIYEGRRISVNLSAFVFDAPAMAFAKYTKYHSGHYSCPKCDWKRASINHRLTFPHKTAGNLRSDGTFRMKTQPEHHRGTSVLEKLKVDMVSQIPFDYMHCVCLGVVKLVLRLLLFGRSGIGIPKPELEFLSKAPLLVQPFVPKEFSRKLRVMFDVRY